MEQHVRYGEAKRITLIGAWINILQGILKIIFGVLGNSHALIADGIHSFSDLFSNAVVIFAARYGSEAADHDHPYGHARIETAATIALAMLITVAGVGIMYDAAKHIFALTPVKPDFYVLIIALISVIANEVIFRYTLRVADKIKSELLRANAWHCRSDAASSLVVLIGVAGALLGFIYLDAIAALLVGGMVLKMAWELAWSSLRELVDTGLDKETIEAIKDSIRSTPGVRTLHQLRTRLMAGKVLLDVHIQVDPFLSVSEGHYIGQQVHFNLMRQFDNISDVTVHIDPEDDELSAPSLQLPIRAEVLARLQECFAATPYPLDIKSINLHYLAGKLHIEILIPLENVADKNEAKAIAAALKSAVKDEQNIASIKVIFS